MSTRKRPLSELSQNQIHTPSRYAPSTPHAIRALQQRSGAKTRSARAKKFNGEVVRPDSARGILRRLAKITAPYTKKTLRTPRVSIGKENEAPEEDAEEDLGKRPRMTFDIEESIEEGLNEEDDDDSQLPTAPTPSILPDDEDHPTMTFKSIDFGLDAQTRSEKIDRRKSKLLFAGLDDDEHGPEDEDDDPTILTERGRRAISEEPSRRLSRYSFGSLRMSDFGPNLEIGRNSDHTAKLKDFDAISDGGGLGFDFEDVEYDIGGETENLRRLRSSSAGPLFVPNDQSPIADENSQFQLPESPGPSEKSHRFLQSDSGFQPFQDDAEDDFEDVDEVENEQSIAVPSMDKTRRLTHLEMAAPNMATKSRRKRLKMTRHGTVIPSLPTNLVKRIARETQNRLEQRRCAFGREHMRALEQATEWFFEQIGEDLEAFSNHGRRKKTIDGADVLMLMRRQRVVGGEGELEKLAKDWLPAKFLAELDLPGKP